MMNPSRHAGGETAALDVPTVVHVAGGDDFGDAEDNEWLVDEILTHKWEGNKISFLLQWNLDDTTWEPYSECKDLAALDRYLELLGINNWKVLPRKASATKARDAMKSRPQEKLMSKGSSTDATASAVH